MIHELLLRNFKCFEDLRLPIRPLTVLTGLNGMGKSTVVQALLLLRQSFQSGDLRAGRLMLNGEFVRLGSGFDLLYEDAQNDEIEVGVALRDADVVRNFLFHVDYDRKADRLNETEIATTYAFPSFPPFKGRFNFLSAERLGPRETLPLSDFHARRGDVGVKGQYVWSVLMEEATRSLSPKDPRFYSTVSARLIDQIDVWLGDISPGAHLEFEPIRAADVLVGGYRFDRTGDVRSNRYRATNVGFGLSYCLPVIVCLLTAKIGSLVILENPEAHLHPRGQTRLGELAALAAAAGVQIVVETHSEHFIDGIRLAVKNQSITPDRIAIHFFVRDGIRAKVISPEVTEDGRLTEWPEGFFDQHDLNLARLIAPASRHD